MALINAHPLSSPTRSLINARGVYNGVYGISAYKIGSTIWITLPPLLSSQIIHFKRLTTIWKKFGIFGKIFGIFQILAKNAFFQHISAYKIRSTIGIMLPPLLSSQTIHFEKLDTVFGINMKF